jgi:hypothetical protein
MMTDDNFMAALNDYADSMLARYVKMTSPVNDIISKRKAGEMFGRYYVDNLIKEKKISVHRQSEGGKCYLSIAEIKQIQAQESIANLRWKNNYNN